MLQRNQIQSSSYRKSLANLLKESETYLNRKPANLVDKLTAKVVNTLNKAVKLIEVGFEFHSEAEIKRVA